MPAPDLPNFESPPVDEIIAAIQFRAMARFRVPEIVRLDAALSEWNLVDTADAFHPIVEPMPGEASFQQFALAMGGPPQRAVFERPDGLWTLQVQHDRIALTQRRGTDRPSCDHTLPELERQFEAVRQALDVNLSPDAAPAELVELIYVNRLDADRGFFGAHRLGELFRGIQDPPGEAPFHHPAFAHFGWVFDLSTGENFVGRLRVEAAAEPSGQALHLQLMSRRYVGESDAFEQLALARADIVKGFTALTTDQAHRIWKRYQ